MLTPSVNTYLKQKVEWQPVTVRPYETAPYVPVFGETAPFLTALLQIQVQLDLFMGQVNKKAGNWDLANLVGQRCSQARTL